MNKLASLFFIFDKRLYNLSIELNTDELITKSNFEYIAGIELFNICAKNILYYKWHDEI